CHRVAYYTKHRLHPAHSACLKGKRRRRGPEPKAEGRPKDEPVSQRWGKVQSELWRGMHPHSPTAPRCLRAARYGRTARDLRRTGRVFGWHRSKRTYKRKRNGERGSVSSRTAEEYLKRDESRVTE